MPSALVLLPAALLAVGAAVALWQRTAAPVAAWAAGAAAFGLWAQNRGSLELAVGTLGGGTPVTFRLDSVALVCSIAILLPGAVLLTRGRGSEASRLLALAAAQLAVTSGDLVLAALAAGAAVALGGLQSKTGPGWMLWAGVLAGTLAGVALQWTGGTATYGAAPAAALTAGIAGLLLLAAVLFSGAVPVGSWVPGAWSGAPILVAALPPIGVCLLFRLYEIGDGRLPSAALAAGLAAWAVLAMLAAAWRAQAVAAPSGLAAEAVPELAAFGLLAAAAGGVLGGAALAIVVLALGVRVALLASTDPRRRSDGLIAAALLAGLPATIGFGARVLALQALVEAQSQLAFWILPAIVAWLVWMLACARAAGLASAGGRIGAWAAGLAGVSVAASAALGALVAGVAVPAARDASLGAIGPRPAADALTLAPASGGWAPLAVALVAVLLVVAAVAAHGRLRVPKLEPPLPAPPRWLPAPITLRPPVSARAVEAALSGSRPVLWAALIAALAVAVTRIAL